MLTWRSLNHPTCLALESVVPFLLFCVFFQISCAFPFFFFNAFLLLMGGLLFRLILFILVLVLRCLLSLLAFLSLLSLSLRSLVHFFLFDIPSL